MWRSSMTEILYLPCTPVSDRHRNAGISLPFVNSLIAPFVAFLDLNDLWDVFVVLLCECEVTDEGILTSDPALNLYGIEATIREVRRYW